MRYNRNYGAGRGRRIVSFLVTRSVVVQIIILTSLISISGFVASGFFPELFDYFSLRASNILAGRNVWTLLTHIAFHANFVHLFVNMFTLFFIGGFVEMLIGKKRFIWFYIIAGITAGLVYTLFAALGSVIGLTSVLGNVNIPAVGASGAVFGLLGILAVLIPNKRVYLIAGPIIVIIVQVILGEIVSEGVYVIASVILNLLMLVMIFAIFVPGSAIYRLSIPISMPLWLAPIIAIVPLVIISFFVSLPIGNTAHFGGLIAGLAYGYYLRRRYRKKVYFIGRYFK